MTFMNASSKTTTDPGTDDETGRSPYPSFKISFRSIVVCLENVKICSISLPVNGLTIFLVPNEDRDGSGKKSQK